MSHQTLPNKVSAHQLPLEHANDGHDQPLTLFAAVIKGQTVTGRMTRILTQEELMQ
jgi:hypothetical protein